MIKASTLNQVSSEKTMLYQLVVSVPLLAAGVLVFGEHIDAMPSAVALGALAYQAIWVVCVTYMAWFALIVRYSAIKTVGSFTFLTPLFGVVAGHWSSTSRSLRLLPWRWRSSPSGWCS